MGDLPTEFNFDEGTPEDFATFIAAIRAGLTDTQLTVIVGGQPHVVPILAPQVRASDRQLPRTFDLRLTGGGQTVVVRLRRDNLYIIGFQPNTGTRWYELPHGTGRQLIPGAEVLRFQGNYNDLIQRPAANMDLQDVPLNAATIQGRVRALAVYNQTPNTIERGILTLAIVIAEAARITEISQFVQDSWWNQPPALLGAINANMIRNWGRSSEALLRHAAIGEFTLPDVALIPNLSAAIAVLGILLFHTIPVPGPSGSRPKRSVIAADTSSSYPSGQSLLEIFYIMVDNIDDENPGELYGTISVTDGAGTVNLWSRSSSNYVSTPPGELIILEGPPRPLYAADGLTITLDLWDEDLISDDPIAQGTLAFNPFDYDTQYDVVKRDPVSGTNGRVTVSYMALSDALYAQISVALINGDGEDPADVFGDMAADNGYGASALFHKTEKEHIDVKPNHFIPLARNLVAVPTNGTLSINADLWDYDEHWANPNDQIAKGIAKFQPLYKKSESKRITGAYGEIEVQVSWL
ncbi:hypothetical protein D9757_009245 [Collybiopsis confluens]|uniref:DUF6598 domain-containing protein n=1 Tax=Collybiopsis confluens TaxID=2823264 RepID=A0A8H5M3Q2_9AGAR|nr:hypothetical protein D9757_009245 [Collybiopsis confluens]